MLSRCGYVLTAFYAMFALARVVMPRVTTLIGERRALKLYTLPICAGSVIIWQVRNLVANGAVLALIGFMQGQASSFSRESQKESLRWPFRQFGLT